MGLEETDTKSVEVNKNCVGTESFFAIYFLARIFDPVGDLNRFGIRLLKVFLCLGVKFWIYFLVTSWVHNFLSIGIMFGGFDGNIFGGMFGLCLPCCFPNRNNKTSHPTP